MEPDVEPGQVAALKKSLAEALEQQTAVSEILRVISSSPADLKPMLNAVAERALKLCDAAQSGIFLVEGNVLRYAAGFGSMLAPMENESYALTRGLVVGRAAIDRETINLPDIVPLLDIEYPDARGPQQKYGFRALLAVPLMREDRAIGAIALWRTEARRFTDQQVALVKTFADQAAIALENVRLFNETKEALEQRTATADILRVISGSPTDTQPVFEVILDRATKLCDAETGILFRYENGAYHAQATRIPNAEWAATFKEPRRPGPGSKTGLGRLMREKRTVHIPDLLRDVASAEGDPGRLQTLRGGVRTWLGVPLLKEGELIGAILVYRSETRAFGDKQILLLETFADQAVIAIENVRLFTELETRTTQLTRSVGELKALGEVGQAVSSTLDLETVLRTIVSRATQLAGMDGGAIYEYDETREEFHLHATDNLPDELVEALRTRPIPKGEGVIGRLAVTGEPVEIGDIADDGSYQSRVRDILIRLGSRSLLAVPLLREDHLLGGLVVNRKSSGEFAPQVIELLKTFATQSAVAIQNARLFREIEEKSRELESASRHKSEFLANMSHELRTPLNAIIGFSEVLSERLFGEINDKQAEYLGDILESGQHLLSLINDILDLSKIEAGRMELEPAEFDLPSAIENTLTLMRERASRHGIKLNRALDEHVGTVRADERKVKQVLLNLLSNALKFTPEGGRVEVTARKHDGVAEISVTDTGVGIAPEDQGAVFEEFRQVGAAVKKVEGTGLGLAISRKFIELHGGRIWVTSEVGTGSTFTFTLPLQ